MLGRNPAELATEPLWNKEMLEGNSAELAIEILWIL